RRQAAHEDAPDRRRGEQRRAARRGCTRARECGEGSMTPEMIVPLALPAGAVTIAAPPALWGAACASYLGMTPAHARRVLAEMAHDKSFAAHVVILSRRPRELAAAPVDVVRFLRARRPALETEGPRGDGVEDESDRILAEMGLPRKG